MSVNKVILVGRLGSDPEVRYTQGGSAVANFNVATNEVWTDKSGQKQERTEWHRVVVWGKQAELAKQYLTKGRQVYLEGKLQTRQWQDKEGQTKYTTEVQVQTIQFLGGGNASVNAGSSSRSDYGAGAVSGGQTAPAPAANDFNQDLGTSFTEDDIPF